jgi:integrase
MLLTTAAVRRRKAQRQRVEIPDGNGLHLIIQPSGKKSWALRFRAPNGKPVKLTLGTVDETGQELVGEPVIGGHLTLPAARKLTAEVHRLRALGRDPVAERKSEKLRQRSAITNAAETSFLADARFYIEHGRKKRTAKGIDRNRRWRATAAILGLAYLEDGGEPTLINGGLAERWRDKPIAEITSEDIAVAVDDAIEKGIPGRSVRNTDSSLNRGHEQVSALSGMFRFLHEKRRVPFNPCLGVHRPAAPAARDRVLNVNLDRRGADELRWLWKACAAVGDPMGSLVQLLLLTGQRRAEVTGITIEELTDDLTCWHLPGKRTKNGREHQVPLPPLARSILANLIGDRKAGLVFVGETGVTPPSGFSKFKKLLDQAMLVAAREEHPTAVITPWTLHDLRRTAVTGMVELGVAPHVVEAVVNHISGSRAGVAGIYNRSALTEPKRKALERWASYVQGVVSETPDQKVFPMKRRQKAS